MPKEKTAVLGISIGTRKLGVGVIKDGELLDWRVTVFKGIWSNHKLSRIIRYIELYALRYQVLSIALKVPSLIDSSPGLQPLITTVIEQCSRDQINVGTYRIEDLKRYCFPDERSNKKALTQYLLDKFPEIYSAARKEKQNRNPYYTPMFEAIIAALVHLKKYNDQRHR